MAEKILKTEFSEEMKTSYINYSMSVITARAIPDIRDGLKPVQRRVLYGMNELGVHANKPTLKSARIVGDVMGKYHPHGDSSIYETLVVMAQDFKRMVPLAVGQGNFGSIEGDSPAAQRYTEARLSKFTDDVMLADLDKTVDFMPNYDEKLKEPTILPCRFPNFLLNGSEGIAVGMATSSPSHNLSEICDLVIEFVKNPNITLKSMLKILKGPDFPTGGIIANMSELPDIYKTGVGKLKLRGKIVYEMAKKSKDKDKLVVTEIPYTMIGDGIGKFMADVGTLVEQKKIPEITDIYNHSSKDGMRIVMELKKDLDKKKIENIKNILYKKTRLEDTYGVNMIAIVDGRPETMTLKSIMENFVKFQRELIARKYKNLLDKENERKEIQEGLIKATDLIDAIIATLRASKTREDAKAHLTTGKCKNVKIKDKKLAKVASKFSFTSLQADAILDMRLYKLIGLEITDLNNEYKDTLAKIKLYKSILKEKSKVDNLIIDDMKKIKKDFGVERKTSFEDAEEIVIEEPKAEVMDVIYCQDKFGYCKVMDPSLYEKNKETVETNNQYVFKARTDERAVIFGSKGFMHQIRLDKVPMLKTNEKGKPIDNLSKFKTDDESIVGVETSKSIENAYLFFVTKDGLIKFADTSEYVTANAKVVATKVNGNDEVVKVLVCYADKDLVIRTNDGFFLRLKPDEVPLLGRATKGVKGIKLGKGDYVVDAYVLDDDTVANVDGKNKNLNQLKRCARATKGSKL
ncbi:MAG: DNA topoisomerase [Lachnospiraceae bacterium]|nr:DNA topoisomerase [Lachnospiraceae bacterium]